MIGLEDINTLFGKKRARLAFFFIVTGLILYISLIVYTNNNIIGWVRSFYKSPFAINQLWAFQTTPEPHYAVGDMYGKSIKVFNGFTLTVPLQIINKSDRLIYIDKIVIRYDCMKDFNSYEAYKEAVPSLYGYTTAQYDPSGPKNANHVTTPQPLFMNYQGGYIEGSCSNVSEFHGEIEMLNSEGTGDSKKIIPANYPLKLDAHSDIILFCDFELELHNKEGQSWRKAGGIMVDKKELEETIVKISPIFFGERYYDEENATLTLYTSDGTHIVRIKTTNIFVGDVIAFPTELVKPEMKRKK